MHLGERVLLHLSKAPNENSPSAKDDAVTLESALDLLHRVYPNLSSLVSRKRVVDFGCGTGYQSIALVKTYDCSVVGIDTNKKSLETAIRNAARYKAPSEQLSFTDHISPSMHNSYDVVISQNSFEHFSNPEQVLDEMRRLLTASGILLITFGPPWFAPYGSHMQFFCRIPWVNIFFSERTVMAARRHFRDDGAARYEDVESGLNKMSVARFESILSSQNLRVRYKQYECTRGINWLSVVPALRELFINHVTVVLSKTT